MNIQIEPYTSEDPGELLQFARSNFISTYAHLNNPKSMESYLEEHFTPGSFRKEYDHPHSTFFVARKENEIIGYFKVNTKDAQTESGFPDGCEIERIYVTQDLKGKGIGKMLFFAAVEYARNLNKNYVWLGVWEHNHSAIYFYEKVGMKQFGSHTFRLGEEAQRDLLMRMKIS